MFSKHILLGFVTAVALPAAALGQTPPAPRPPATAPRPAGIPFKPEKLPANVVARVNGQNITRDQTFAMLATLGGQPLLREMINDSVIEQEARKQGVRVTEAEVAKEIADIRRKVPEQTMAAGNPMSFSEYVAREGISEGLLRWSVRRRLMTRKTYHAVLESQIKTPDLTGQIGVSHILIATQALPGSDPSAAKPLSDDDAKKKIEALRGDIVSNKTTFVAAARASSNDPGSAARGGSLGFLAKNGNFLPEFTTAAFALKKVGDISEPFKTQYGWHIIRLDKTQATAEDRTALRNQAIANAEQNQQQFNAWLAGLVRNAKVSINPAAMTGAAVPGGGRKVSSTAAATR